MDTKTNNKNISVKIKFTDSDFSRINVIAEVLREIADAITDDYGNGRIIDESNHKLMGEWTIKL